MRACDNAVDPCQAIIQAEKSLREANPRPSGCIISGTQRIFPSGVVFLFEVNPDALDQETVASVKSSRTQVPEMEPWSDRSPPLAMLPKVHGAIEVAA